MKLFAPRLQPGDRVVYLTQKGKYGETPFPHRRLVAVLDVVERFETHSDAAAWYQSRGFSLPSNCMVPANLPTPYELTSKMFPEREWDAGYAWRARQSGTFLACRPSYVELQAPPVVSDSDLHAVFDRIPGTRNPGKLDRDLVDALLYGLGIDI